MGHRLADLRALARCWRLAAGLPSAAAYGCHMLGSLADAYEGVVAPIVARTVGDDDERARVSRALRAMSIKAGTAIMSYARMAGGQQQRDVAALAGAIARLYDDLIDGSADESRDNGLGDLFNVGPAAAHSELERLLAELACEIKQRIHPTALEPVISAFNELHEYQCLSRQQRDEEISLAAVEKICRVKGALANLTVCSLVKPDMNADESELVMSVGEVLQSLDDYADAAHDARNGVTTLAVLGEMTLADIGADVRALRCRLADHYGGPPARRYCGMLFFLVLQTMAGRRLAVIGRLAGRLASRYALMAFLTRGPNALPAALPPRGDG